MTPPRPVQPGDVTRSSERTSAVLDVERLAECVAARVADLLRDGGLEAQAPAMLDVAEVARRLGASLDYVRYHADELGAVQLPGSLVRFDPAVVEAKRAAARYRSEQSDAAEPPVPPEVPKGRRRRPTGARPDLLPIKGQRAA